MNPETSLKVAFATTNMETVNQHFGAAQAFAIYTVDPEHFAVAEVIEFGELKQDGNEDKLAAKITALDGCVAVYSQAVGASAMRQLTAAGVQPVKVSADSPIKDLLHALQDELQSGPATWLARAIEKNKGPDPSRFDAMEAEGWEE
ncbi:MAG: NifB/NifX family molybdenum-iron cluster-binding protein [Gammaproteobacteria bacterium]